MSDALQHAPSFDELVGLIKKLVTDYLEDVIKSKLSEIEKSWERYKTLNHLYQDGKPQPGAVWVKGAPKEQKQSFGRVQSVLHDDKTYDVVIYPIANSDHWWAVGKDFKCSVHKDKIIAHIDESVTAAGREEDLRAEIDRRNKLLEDGLKLQCRLNMPGISEQEQERAWATFKLKNSL